MGFQTQDHYAADIWNAQLAGGTFSRTPYTEKQTNCGKCHIKDLIPGKTDPAYNGGEYPVKRQIKDKLERLE